MWKMPGFCNTASRRTVKVLWHLSGHTLVLAVGLLNFAQVQQAFSGCLIMLMGAYVPLVQQYCGDYCLVAVVQHLEVRFDMRNYVLGHQGVHAL